MLDVIASPPKRVAVIGAGLAGASCARALHEAGWAVTVFDKARGPGGRLATRRTAWCDAEGCEQLVALDHGCPGFVPHSTAFQAFVEAAGPLLQRWQPRPAPHSAALGERAALWVPSPSLPNLCRQLLDGIALKLETPVQTLRAEAGRWQLDARPERYDAVLLALPPAQAAPLLAPHRPGWALRCATKPLQPCWTLMGVAEAAPGETEWDALVPRQGPLAWVARNESRPGRLPAGPGLVHWVAQARADWSAEQLDQGDAAERLDAALAEALGHPLRWRLRLAHRWRYATPSAHCPRAEAWWDGVLRLGACGDFLGGAGVEGAWLSGRALAAALRGVPTSMQVPAALPVSAAVLPLHGASA